jgi:hypothetical protein
VRMEDNELTKKILWTNPGGQRGRSRPKSRSMGYRKTPEAGFYKFAGGCPG